MLLPFGICAVRIYEVSFIGTLAFTGVMMSLGWLIFTSPSNEPWLVLLAVSFIVGWSRKRLRPFLISAIGVGAVFVAFDWSHFLESFANRAELFINSIYLWLDAPLWGHGLGGFDYYYSDFQEKHIPWLGAHTLLHPASVYAGAAHNEILQVLCELGLMGLVFIFGIATCLRWNDDPISRAARWTVIISLTLSMVSFPLHNPMTAFIFAVALGICCARRSPYACSPFHWEPLRAL